MYDKCFCLLAISFAITWENTSAYVHIHQIFLNTTLMCILHKLQSVLTGTTMRGSLSMFSKVLTTSTEKLFLQKQKKVHRLYLKNKSTFITVIFTTHILYKHTGSKVGKKAVQDRWMMPAFWIQGNKKLDCWTNRLNCLNVPIYRKKSTGKGVVREGTFPTGLTKWVLKRAKESLILISCQSTAWEVTAAALACLKLFGNIEKNSCVQKD